MSIKNRLKLFFGELVYAGCVAIAMLGIFGVAPMLYNALAKNDASDFAAVLSGAFIPSYLTMLYARLQKSYTDDAFKE